MMCIKDKIYNYDILDHAKVGYIALYYDVSYNGRYYREKIS